MYQKYNNKLQSRGIDDNLSKTETGIKRKSCQVDVDENPTEDTDVPTDEDVLSSNYSNLDVASLRSSARRWKMAHKHREYDIRRTDQPKVSNGKQLFTDVSFEKLQKALS